MKEKEEMINDLLKTLKGREILANSMRKTFQNNLEFKMQKNLDWDTDDNICINNIICVITSHPLIPLDQLRGQKFDILEKALNLGVQEVFDSIKEYNFDTNVRYNLKIEPKDIPMELKLGFLITVTVNQ